MLKSNNFSLSFQTIATIDQLEGSEHVVSINVSHSDSSETSIQSTGVSKVRMMITSDNSDPFTIFTNYSAIRETFSNINVSMEEIFQMKYPMYSIDKVVHMLGYVHCSMWFRHGF